jgi:hypothetical protein
MRPGASTSSPNSSPISRWLASDRPAIVRRDAVDGQCDQTAPFLARGRQRAVEQRAAQRRQHLALSGAERPSAGGVEPAGEGEQQAAGDAGADELAAADDHRSRIRVRRSKSAP